MKVGKPTLIMACLNQYGSSGFGMKISQIAEEIINGFQIRVFHNR